jgi:putative transposase
VTPRQRRAAAGFLLETRKVSERHASRVLDCSRSSLRYRPSERPDEQPLIAQIRLLAREFPRWGYRLVHGVLTGQSHYGGWTVNLKRVRRLWRDLDLVRPVRHKKPKKLGPKRGSGANSCDKTPALFKNDVWCYDFVADRTIDGSPLKWLTLVDEYTRESLALDVHRAMRGEDVRKVLSRVMAWRGASSRIRSDNGSEFICEALTNWLPTKGTTPIQVEPGCPWQNGYAESFNSRFRDECLENDEFESVEDAQAKGDWYRPIYNRIRPHSALAYKTPKQFSDECDRGLHGRQPATS